MDIGMRVMTKMTEYKIKECLEDLSLSTEEKDIVHLNVRRPRTLEGKHWYKKTIPDRLINWKMENCW